MPLRFGEQISDDDAYNTARAATTYMDDAQLQRLAQRDTNSPHQAQAVADEQRARAAKRN